MAQVTLQKERLDLLSEEENLQREIARDETLLGNMTIAEIIQDMAREFLRIIQELLSLTFSPTLSFPLEIIQILIREKRLIYLGIVLMFSGMFSMLAKR